MNRPARPAFFFDRDGTLNREIEGALSSPEQLELFADAAEAVRLVNQAGWFAVVVSNQSAIARGWMTHYELERVQAELERRLAAGGARLDLALSCPHLEDDGFAPYRRPCACRKPAPGLLRRAAERLEIDLARSWLAGDALRDLAAAEAAGAASILVRTGKGKREEARLGEPGSPRPRAVVDGVAAAVRFALAQGLAPGA